VFEKTPMPVALLQLKAMRTAPLTELYDTVVRQVQPRLRDNSLVARKPQRE